MAEVKKLPALLETELAEIPDAKKGTMLLREDVAVLEESSREEKSVRLLPLFDPYLLAHREKDHLLSTQHYKRVYRNQGWISPVVLVDGVIAAVWSHKLKNRNLLVEVQAFQKFSKPIKVAIEREAYSLAEYFESSVSLKFT
jgi:endonuclease/exonuclease/phosphatase family metal-dependent hydrolase